MSFSYHIPDLLDQVLLLSILAIFVFMCPPSEAATSYNPNHCSTDQYNGLWNHDAILLLIVIFNLL